MLKRYAPGILALMLIAIAGPDVWLRSRGRTRHVYYIVIRWVGSHRAADQGTRQTDL
jgi:hypothetical protein